MHEVELFGSRLCEIDAALGRLRQPVVDAHKYNQIVFEIGDLHQCAEGKAFMSGREAVVAELFAAACFAAIELIGIKAGNALVNLRMLGRRKRAEADKNRDDCQQICEAMLHAAIFQSYGKNKPQPQRVERPEAAEMVNC